MGIRFFSAALVSMLLLGGTAHAGLINGELQLSGKGAILGVDSNGDSIVSYNEATGVDFFYGTSKTAANDNKAMVSDAIGDFAGFASFGDIVSVSDLTFAALGDFWNIGSLKFTISSIAGTGTQDISGFGVVKDSSGTFDDSFATFDLHFTGTESRFSFVSSTNVPEPGTILLMGLGVLMIVMARRKSTKSNGKSVITNMNGIATA